MNNRKNYFFVGPVRRAMKAKGIRTQAQLAVACGLPQPTVSRFLSGRSARDSSVLRICIALDLKIEKLRDIRLTTEGELF